MQCPLLAPPLITLPRSGARVPLAPLPPSSSFIQSFTPPLHHHLAQVLEFPVQMLIRFWVNHHLLDIFQRPLWRVIKGRSRTYVDKVTRGVSEGGVGVME